MCGIVGWLAAAQRPAPDAALLSNMAQKIAHRGPDAQQISVVGPIGLGHRRLSVIDLQDAANQPMVDSSGLFHLIFNGEIYNYKDLKRDLESRGHHFRTESDTEVLLEAYKCWGEDCLDVLEGMFAFALWDVRQKSLFLARDRMGKKPLYYGRLPTGDFLFGSEVKALMAHPEMPLAMDLRSIIDVLEIGYILGPKSAIASIEQLEPAQSMIVTQEGIQRQWFYWDLASFFCNPVQSWSFEEATAQLQALTDEAVTARMVADVPLGAFLSGGLDSTSIVASMARYQRSQGYDADTVQSFSIGFQEKGYSELPEAQAMAKDLGLHHRDEIVTLDHIDDFERLCWFMDAPFADSSFIPMYYLAKMTREHVTVALSGDGADELFAGYSTYGADRLHGLLRCVPRSLASAFLQSYQTVMPASHGKVSFDYKIRQFLAARDLSPEEAHYSWRQLFKGSEWAKILDPDLCADLKDYNPYDRFAHFYRDVDGCDPLNRALYVDLKTWLVDDILVKVDRTTMAHSLEARTPFLDRKIVEFAAGLPAAFKMKGREQKRILRKAQENYLPKDLFRRKKRGFNAPIAHWIDRLAEIMLQDASGTNELFQKNAITGLVEEHMTRRRDNGFRLLALASLNVWHNRPFSR